VEATEALNAVVLFRDRIEGGYPVDVSRLKPVARGADINDRLNYLRGNPYPPKKKKAKKAGA
jgi:hypothetical protein